MAPCGRMFNVYFLAAIVSFATVELQLRWYYQVALQHADFLRVKLIFVGRLEEASDPPPPKYACDQWHLRSIVYTRSLFSCHWITHVWSPACDHTCQIADVWLLHAPALIFAYIEINGPTKFGSNKTRHFNLPTLSTKTGHTCFITSVPL